MAATIRPKHDPLATGPRDWSEYAEARQKAQAAEPKPAPKPEAEA